MNAKIILPLCAPFIFSALTGCATGSATQPNQTLSGISQVLQQSQQVVNAVQTASTVPATGTTTPVIGASQAVQSVNLVDVLVQKLGVTQTQAQLGAGAIFQVAQGQMQPSAFSQLAQAVPGMSTLLSAAQQPTTLGGLASSTGNSTLALAAAFQQQGMSPTMVQQFIPVVLQYVTNTGGTAVASSLNAALVAK